MTTMLRDRLMTTKGARLSRGGVALVVLLTGCAGEEPDAYGNFEAEEVTVSAEAAGRLVRFDVREGVRLEAGAVVGVVDTTLAVLELRELEAQQAASRAQAGQAAAQVEALRAELETARSEHERTRRLFAGNAVTTEQLEREAGRLRVLEEQLRAALLQAAGADEQAAALAARLETMRERIARSRVTNPVDGTVLAIYARAGEFVQPGQPLYRVAPLDTLELRVYVSGAQLAGLRLGQEVAVRVDQGDELVSLPGVVSWIADRAEFTPTPVQTREERTGLSYAVKIRVPNADGLLKIGMPADVSFGGAEWQ